MNHSNADSPIWDSEDNPAYVDWLEGEDKSQKWNRLIRIYLHINFVFDDDALFQHKTESDERRTSDWWKRVAVAGATPHNVTACSACNANKITYIMRYHLNVQSCGWGEKIYEKKNILRNRIAMPRFSSRRYRHSHVWHVILRRTVRRSQPNDIRRVTQNVSTSRIKSRRRRHVHSK